MTEDFSVNTTEIRAELDRLRAMGSEVRKTVRAAELPIAQRVAADARMFAVGTSAQASHFASQIVGRVSNKGASIGLRSSIADAAIWGAKQWFGRNYKQHPHPSNGQSPRWVGNDWPVGSANAGPIGINPAIYHDQKFIMDAYGDAVLTAARESGAFT